MRRFHHPRRFITSPSQRRILIATENVIVRLINAPLDLFFPSDTCKGELTGLLIFIYDTASDIQACSRGSRVNTSISLKPFIKAGRTLQWPPYFTLHLGGWKVEIKHKQKLQHHEGIKSILYYCTALACGPSS